MYNVQDFDLTVIIHASSFLPTLLNIILFRRTVLGYPVARARLFSPEMHPSDSFNIIFLLLYNVIIFINNKLFILFIESKPEGRKTVLGMPKIILNTVKIYITRPRGP